MSQTWMYLHSLSPSCLPVFLYRQQNTDLDIFAFSNCFLSSYLPIQATKHRVVDLGVDRFSLPFFLEPRYFANINKVMPMTLDQGQKVAEETEAPADDVVKVSGKGDIWYGPWVVHSMSKYAEYRDTMRELKKNLNPMQNLKIAAA